MALTAAGKHPNQCMKKGGDPARHLETQPLLSTALENSTWDKENCTHQETRCFPPEEV